MADSAASTIIFSELTGEKRSILLRGSALPFRPTTWSVLQKLVTTWNGGNSQATQHVLGPQDPPADWEGSWHRTLLGKLPAMFQGDGGTLTPIILPVDLRDLFDDFCRKGRLLSVKWTSTDGVGAGRPDLVRTGRIARIDFPHHRVDDIGWKMNFEWTGRGGSSQKVVASRDGNIVAAAQQIVAAANDLNAKALRASLLAKNATIPRSANFLSLGQLEALTQLPNNLLTGFLRSITRVTGQLGQLGDIILQAKAIPAQLSNTALMFANNATAQANQFADALDRTPVELLTSKTQTADVTRAARYFWQTHGAAQVVARAARAMRTRITSPTMRASAQATRTIIAVHVVKQTETLMSLSVRYYGNPDHADAIARSNRLPWHTISVAPGKVLIIPVLATSQQV